MRARAIGIEAATSGPPPERAAARCRGWRGVPIALVALVALAGVALAASAGAAPIRTAAIDGAAARDAACEPPPESDTAAASDASRESDAREESAAARYDESIDVIAITPLRGVGVRRDVVPSNVQSASATDLERTGALHLAVALARSFASASLAEAQSNPFQPDLVLRGFTVSPLLGLPQGIAVYQDGVRVNEPFGDTLHWDLLPDNALAGVDFLPGSTPLFGLNALGGALSLRTRTGWDATGHGAGIEGGSFGRVMIEAETGGHGERAGWFLAARGVEEDGWRDHSPSLVRQLFGSFEHRAADGATLLDATATGGSNRLVGNGAAPIELLDEDREAVFTHPDRTETELEMLATRAQRLIASDLTLEGNAYFRRSAIDTENGDDTPYEECDDDGLLGLLCAEDEDEPIRDQNGDPIAVGDDPLDATDNTSATGSDAWGVTLQTTLLRPLAARDNHLVGGAAFDAARSRYASDTELARLTADRGTVGSGLVDSGAAVRLRTEVEHASLWLADYLTVTPALTVSGSARYTRSRVRLLDRLGEDLDGDHRFSRLNPSLGLTWAVRDGVTLFAGASEASRVPAPSELSCADPEDPCRLPNAFVADPPLDQVVARTWEAGARGRAGKLTWSGALFHTRNRDDIVFVSSGALTNEGHFENVGDTLREGLELSASGSVTSSLRWQATYSHLRAEFRTPLTLSSPNHPAARDGEIDVEPGDELPGIPRHRLEAQLAWTAGRTSVAASASYGSERHLRGDEANLLPALDGFVVVNAAVSWAVHPRVLLTARADNLLDTEYETFGLLGEPDEVLGDAYEDPRFLGPGAPRGVWVGVELGLP